MKTFFRIVRILLGPWVLLIERLTRPTAPVRGVGEQQKLDTQTAGLVLYQFRTCPFCAKVRNEIRRLGLKIELRDAQGSGPGYEELVRGGGTYQTPCLRIPDSRGQGGYRWLYESSDINSYLKSTYG